MEPSHSLGAKAVLHNRDSLKDTVVLRQERGLALKQAPKRRGRTAVVLIISMQHRENCRRIDKHSQRPASANA